MNTAHIQSMKLSIQNVFGTMFELPIEISEPTIDPESTHGADVSGIIGVSGALVGTIVLSMPISTARAFVDHSTGQHAEIGSHDFADTIGELVNMISGCAKAAFGHDDVSISCPSVVIGSGHIIAHQSGVPRVMIPCETACGVISIELSLRESLKHTPISSSAA
jgi:chemotaxis protein CheX